MSTEDSIKRHIVQRSSLERANREYTNESTLPNGSYDEKLDAPRVHFVPSSVKSTLGSPTALAIGAFSTTLTTLSLSLMEWRGVSTSNVFIGNCKWLIFTWNLITPFYDSSLISN